MLARLSNRTLIAVTVTAISAIGAFAFAPAASADSASIINISRVDSSRVQTTIRATYDSCSDSYCGWFPFAHWVKPTESCPDGDSSSNYVFVGHLQDSMGSQDNTGTFYSSESSLVVCVYIYDGVNRLIAAIPWSDPTIPPEDEAEPAPRTETMYGSEARYYTRSFLRHSKWKIGYKRGTSFRQRCHRVSRVKFKCKVRWRYRGTYRGWVSHKAFVEDGEQMISSRAYIVHHKKKKKSSSGGGSSGCDSSYPTVCIPPPPPDLDCPEISYRNFRVVGSDPHGFDGDRDGVGCET